MNTCGTSEGEIKGSLAAARLPFIILRAERKDKFIMTAEKHESNEITVDDMMDAGEAWDCLDGARTLLAGLCYMTEATLNNLTTGGIPSDPEILEGVIMSFNNSIANIDMKLAAVMDYIEKN